MTTRLRLPLLLSALLLCALPAHAQTPSGRPAVTLTARNQTAAAEAARGAPRRDERVHAGDVLHYRLTFTNVGRDRVRNVELRNPLPVEFRFVPGSAQASRADAKVEYSIDGGKTFSPQPMEEAVVDGRRVLRAASPEKYTHVRWTVGGWVAPGATVTAEFDARLAGAPRGTGTASGPAAGNGGR